jgi:hypothetical protein
VCAFDLAHDLARCAPETELAEAAAAAVAAGGAGGGTTGGEARGAAGGGVASDGRLAAGSEVRDGSSCAEGGGSGGAAGGSAERRRTASAAAGRGGGARNGDGEGEDGGDGGGELASNVAALQRQLVEVRAEMAGLAQVGRQLDLAWLTMVTPTIASLRSLTQDSAPLTPLISSPLIPTAGLRALRGAVDGMAADDRRAARNHRRAAAAAAGGHAGQCAEELTLGLTRKKNFDVRVF